MRLLVSFIQIERTDKFHYRLEAVRFCIGRFQCLVTIRTWDMYDDVLGASAGRYSSLFSTGGDETLKPADAKANRFKPVVKFLGPFYLDKGKQKTHTLKLPM